MTRRTSAALRAVTLVALALAVPACGDGGTEVDPGPDVDRVEVTPASAEIPLEGSTQLAARAFDPEGRDVTADVELAWSSAPGGVVIVDDRGLVSAVSEGEATVRATARGTSGTAVVEVFDPTPPTPPDGVEATVLSDTEIELTWTDRADNETSYVVERERTAASVGGAGPAAVFGEVATLPADATSYTDTGLDPASSYRYRVRACNRNGCVPEPGSAAERDATSEAVTTEETLVVLTDELLDAFVAVEYEAVLESTGGVGEHVWTVDTGDLPPGLSLASDGTLAGTPTAEGAYTFTATVASGGQTASVELTLTVHEEPLAPEVVTTELPDGERDTSYSYQLEARYGDGTYRWELLSGTLPPGVGLSSDGLLSGVPAALGRFDFTVRVRSLGRTGTAALSVVVTAPLRIVTSTLPQGTVDVSYTATLAADGGDGSYDWALVDGTPQAGLVFDAGTARIQGTPTTVGSRTLTFEVTSAGESVSRALVLDVQAAPVRVRTAFLPGAYQGTSYLATLEVSGGDGVNYAWEVVAGILPPGLVLDPASGVLSGAPSQAGVYYFTVEAESGGRSGTHTFAMSVSGKAAPAFNMWVVNVSSSTDLPSQGVVDAISAAVARWEEVIVGDLQDLSYGPNRWSTSVCDGDGPVLNGHDIDDMVVMLNLETIDGPGAVLGAAGPCAIRGGTWPDVNTSFGRLTLDLADIENLGPDRLFALAFHEIGHIVGLGTLWRVPTGFTGTPLMSGDGTSDPRYEGSFGNAEFTGTLSGGSQNAAKAPIEAQGGGGTAYAHWDEGEFDNEILTGYSEPSGTPQPISSLTVAAVGDLAYTVDLGAADPYSIPNCAPGCFATPPAGAAAGSGEGAASAPLDDVWWGPIYVELPGGGLLRVPPPAELR